MENPKPFHRHRGTACRASRCSGVLKPPVSLTRDTAFDVRFASGGRNLPVVPWSGVTKQICQLAQRKRPLDQTGLKHALINPPMVIDMHVYTHYYIYTYV